MEGVVIAVRAGTTLTRFADLLRGQEWQVDLRSEDELVVESGERHAYIIRDDGLASEYDGADIMRVLLHVSNPIFLTLEFNDIDFAKDILELIGNAPDLVIDNDHGDILPGTDFIKRVRENRAWDWRR